MHHVTLFGGHSVYVCCQTIINTDSLWKHGKNSEMGNSIRFGTEFIKYHLKTMNIIETSQPDKLFSEENKEWIWKT